MILRTLALLLPIFIAAKLWIKLRTDILWYYQATTAVFYIRLVSLKPLD